jgi:hypothetical protein
VDTNDRTALLREPSYPERVLLDVIYDGRMQNAEWPIFQWVEKELMMEHHLDARSILQGCPRLTIQPAGIGRYGWIASTNPQPLHQLPGDTLSISIGGLRILPQANRVVEIFLAVLAYLVERERQSTPTPTTVAISTVTSEETLNHLASLGWQLEDSVLSFVGKILTQEPSTWNCGIQISEDGSWSARPDSFLRRYEGVRTGREYLERLIDQISPLSIATNTAERHEPRWEDTGMPYSKYDFFISYASQDRHSVARPLHDSLKKRGKTVWFDEVTLGVGQKLTSEIDRGLADCKAGVVILSKSFFAKEWTQYELSGLVQRMNSGGGRVILPIWHEVSQADVAAFSLPLSNIVALKSSIGVKAMTDKLIESLNARS